MKYSIVGKQALDFRTDKGDLIKGTNCYVLYDDDVEGLIGQKTDKLFFGEKVALPAGLKVGDIIDVSFTKKGKPERVAMIKAL